MQTCKSNNNNDEWFTPKYVIEKVKECFDGVIDLDPCSCEKANDRIKAIEYFDKTNNCLHNNWKGKVFLNPPYSSGLLAHVLSKAVYEYTVGNIDEMIILTNSGTDTRWNRIMLNGTQAYTLGRLRFVYPDGTIAGTPSRGQCFTYFGKYNETFKKVFEKNDFCYLPNITKI